MFVVKPENYTQEKDYPLVILLHGWSNDFMEWNSIIDLNDIADSYNFIIACPDGFYNSWYMNSRFSSGIQYDDYFWKSFIPYLKNKYSIDSMNIFITGFSMGGHGAVRFYLKNPEFFNSAASSSGILDITKFPDNWEIKEVIGELESNLEVWQSNSAFFLLDSLKDLEKNIFVDCGIEDFAYEANLKFVKKCYDLSINVKFISIPGEHNRDHWKRMLPQHIDFFSQQLN